MVVGGYAGWSGSLPASEVERRLAFALDAADRLPGRFEPYSMPGLFSKKLSTEAAALLRVTMSDSRPVAMRSMAHALAEADLGGGLSSIAVPTLLVYGDADMRSPLTVANDLLCKIPTSSLVVLQGLGHECYLEDPHSFNAEVRSFLRAQA